MPAPLTRALTRAVLDAIQIFGADPDTTRFVTSQDGEHHLLLYPRCHANAALLVEYYAGVLTLTCRECYDEVLCVRVWG